MTQFKFVITYQFDMKQLSNFFYFKAIRKFDTLQFYIESLQILVGQNQNIMTKNEKENTFTITTISFKKTYNGIRNIYI